MTSRKLSLDEALAIASEASGQKLWRKKILTIGYESKLGTPIVRWLIHVNTKNRLKSVVPLMVFNFDPFPNPIANPRAVCCASEITVLSRGTNASGSTSRPFRAMAAPKSTSPNPKS